MSTAKSRVIVRLKIESDQKSCQEITDALKMVPSKQWQKGARRPGTSIIEGHNVWIYERSFQQAEKLEAHVRAFLRILEGHQTRITKITKTSAGTLSVVAYTGSMPPLYFDTTVLGAIRKMGLALDIDLYV